jgi:hypothetical protein
MKIPRLYVHEIVSDLLLSLLLQGECVGSEQITINEVVASQLTIPKEALYALIVCTADPSPFLADKSWVINYKQYDTLDQPPNFFIGMPLGHLGVLEVKGKENMEAFRAISVTPGFFHTLRVEYYG